MVCIALCISGGTDDYIKCRWYRLGINSPYQVIVLRFTRKSMIAEKARRINPGRSPDHNLDRNGADDGTGASDIRPRDDNGGNRKRRNSKVYLAGIRG